MLPANFIPELLVTKELQAIPLEPRPTANPSLSTSHHLKMPLTHAVINSDPKYYSALVGRFIYEYVTPNSVAKCPYFDLGILRINGNEIFNYDWTRYFVILYVTGSALTTVPATPITTIDVGSNGELITQLEILTPSVRPVISVKSTGVETSGFIGTLKHAIGYATFFRII